MRISLNYHKYSSSQHILIYTKTYIYMRRPESHTIMHYSSWPACLVNFVNVYVPRFAASFQLKTSLELLLHGLW